MAKRVEYTNESKDYKMDYNPIPQPDRNVKSSFVLNDKNKGHKNLMGDNSPLK